MYIFMAFLSGWERLYRLVLLETVKKIQRKSNSTLGGNYHLTRPSLDYYVH